MAEPASVVACTIRAGDTITVDGRRFTIGDILGTGCAGIVFRAVGDDSREVAVKWRRRLPVTSSGVNDTPACIVEEVSIEAARQIAAAEAGAAPRVIAVDAAAGLIVMELIDAATHEPLQSYLLSRPELLDLDPQRQLAVVRAFDRLRRAGVPYTDDCIVNNVFVPLNCGGEAIIIDYERHEPAPGDDNVWATLWWYWLEHPYSLLLVAAVMRDHKEWFGFDEEFPRPDLWADFVMVVALASRQLGTPIDYSEEFAQEVRTILANAGMDTGVAVGAGDGGGTAAVVGPSSGCAAAAAGGAAAGAGAVFETAEAVAVAAGVGKAAAVKPAASTTAAPAPSTATPSVAISPARPSATAVPAVETACCVRAGATPVGASVSGGDTSTGLRRSSRLQAKAIGTGNCTHSSSSW